jgi:hypothetical protein
MVLRASLYTFRGIVSKENYTVQKRPTKETCKGDDLKGLFVHVTWHSVKRELHNLKETYKRDLQGG